MLMLTVPLLIKMSRAYVCRCSLMLVFLKEQVAQFLILLYSFFVHILIKSLNTSLL